MLNITCLAVADPPLNITSIYWYSYDGTEGSEGNDTEAANGRKKISHAKGYIPVVEHGVSITKSDRERGGGMRWEVVVYCTVDNLHV